MDVKKELKTFGDIQQLVRCFYGKVLNDEILSPFFAYVKTHHWDEHLAALDSFWDNVLFYSGSYHGNPLEVHTKLHYFSRLEPKDFERWLALFNQTLDELFEGEKAELARQRAYSIATIMQLKILYKKEKDNISTDQPD